MPKIAIIDTYYPDFIRSLPTLTGTYEEELEKLLALGFGTADFCSHNLKAQGWECLDIVANHEPLQRLWAAEHGWTDSAGLGAITLGQIEEFRPDVVFLQDLSLFDAATLRHLRQKCFIAAQCSCAPPDRSDWQIDVLFTSLPTHVKKFQALGVERVEYLPLAFDPRMAPILPVRHIPISFVGGVGRNSHWKDGTDVLEDVAAHFKERFHWYGYGLENLSTSSPLRACYRGQAYGKQMYQIYGESKCVVNRHGEVAQGYTNNLRCFEATGCGALLLTEQSPNLSELFPEGTAVPYIDAVDLCEKAEFYLLNGSESSFIRNAGEGHTRVNHTYAQRMTTVSQVLSECLERRQVAQ